MIVVRSRNRKLKCAIQGNKKYTFQYIFKKDFEMIWFIAMCDTIQGDDFFLKNIKFLKIVSWQPYLKCCFLRKNYLLFENKNHPLASSSFIHDIYFLLILLSNGGNKFLHHKLLIYRMCVHTHLACCYEQTDKLNRWLETTKMHQYECNV